MADCVQFLSKSHLNRCQIFVTVRFLKTESKPNFSFPHIPIFQATDCIGNENQNKHNQNILKK